MEGTHMFGDQLYADEHYAIQLAQEWADRDESPVGVWERDRFYTVCDVAPDDEDQREAAGWQVWAVVDPMTGADL
jgi:hypothetical protein